MTSVTAVHPRSWIVVPTLGVAAATAAALAGTLPARNLAVALAGLAILLALVRWPWATLPLDILGGPVLAGLHAHPSVTFVIVVHAGILAAGLLALASRRLFVPSPPRLATPLDQPMLVFTVALFVDAACGLIVGNSHHQLVVAAYEFGVIPAYYLVATLTLATSAWLTSAARLYLVLATALAVIGFASSGRHGGFPSLLALPVVLVAAGRSRGRPRTVLIAVAVVLALDVLLAAYRATWLAAAITALLLVPRGGRSVRRTGAVLLCLSALALTAGLLVSGGLQNRLGVLETELHSSTGYRAAESAVGMHVFAADPLLGLGLGQSRPNIYLPNFRVTSVGPMYHVWYVTLLANGGIVLLVLQGWILLRAVRIGLRSKHTWTVAFTALTVGFAASAAFGGPTDGHWELGLLPALVAVTAGLFPDRTAAPLARTSAGLT
jgi:hypothetical protein